MQMETETVPPAWPAPRSRHEGRSAGRRTPWLGAVALALVVGIGGACSQDTSEGGGSAPEDQPTTGAQQPGGGDDPSLSGEGTDGVGGGNTGGDGSGAPDSGSGDDGSAGQSPTAGEDG